MNQRQNITINTDASFDNTARCAGWAVWISHNGKPIKRSGTFKNHPPTSGDAEKWAILNGIALMQKYLGGPRNGGHIYINTDYEQAVREMKSAKGGHEITQFERRLKNMLKKQLSLLKPQKVAAHSGTSTSRQFVNDWCDKEAKAQMRNQRANKKFKKRQKRA